MEPHYKDGFIEDIHLYREGGHVIFTALFHVQRGKCCGNECRHCPFYPKHKRGSDTVDEKFAHLKKSS
jgi:2-iminoacetate synthase ThiH